MVKDILKEQIKNRDIKNAYLIYGPEKYLIRHYTNLLIDASIKDEDRDFNLNYFDGEKTLLQELEDYINTYPAMCGKKVAVILNFEKMVSKADGKKEFLLLLKNLPDYILLILECNASESDLNSAKFKSLISDLTKQQVICSLQNKLIETDMISFVKRQVIKQDSEITTDSAKFFLSYVENEMLNVINEINKVALYKKGSVITNNDIISVCCKNSEVPRFELTNALCIGDFDKVYSVILELFEERMDHMIIFGIISKALTDMLKAKLAVATGFGEAGLAKDFGMHSYAAKLLCGKVQRISANFIRSGVLFCAEADKSLKSSKADKEVIIYSLIGKLQLCMDKKTERLG